MVGGAFSVEYTGPARADIDAIYHYIAIDNPRAASAVVAAIHQTVEILRQFPEKSRHTRQRRLRAVPLSRYPYIVFFKIRQDKIFVVHVLHGARRHPGFQEEAAAFAR